MSFEIRCASLESQQADLIALFRQNLASDFSEYRFNWLYRRNPYGPARAWVACNSKSGTIVGAAAAFPKGFYFHGSKKLGWVLGDFCLAQAYRSAGPALQLQRACLAALASPYDFCYDFPSRAMMAIYRRLGIQETNALVRWAKPLRIEDRLKGAVRSKTTAKLLGILGNAMLVARGLKAGKEACQVERLQGFCGQEFTVLDERLGKEPGVRAEQTAEYLNWRFLAHPSRSHEILVARRDGTLVGYIVLTREPQDARIVELVSVEDPGVIARLIEVAVSQMQRDGARTVNLVAERGHPWSAIFRQAGFRPRESSPIVVVPRTKGTTREIWFQTNCYLMEGERES